jgi:hypothetical protein
LAQAGLGGALMADDRSGSPVAGPRTSPQAAKAWRTLSKPTVVEFRDLPLTDALRFLQEYHNCPIQKDGDAIKAAGIRLDRLTTIQLQGASLRSVLRLLLEPAGLDFFVNDTGMVITARDRAAASRSEFFYPLADVPRAGIPLADLVEAITQTVEPQSWQKNGGMGSLRVEQQTLYVRQSGEIQDLLEDLLRELFDALSDPQIDADDNRLHTVEYRIRFFPDLGVADGDFLQWLDERVIAGKSPAGGDKEAATIKGDRLILTQPAWVHSVVGEFFDQLKAINNGAKLGRGDFPGHFEVAAGLLSFEGKRRIALKRLARPVTTQLRGLSLGDALLVLKEQSNAKFHVSEEVHDLPAVRKTLDAIMIGNVPLSGALDKVLQPLKLDWYLLDADIIVITTRTAAAGHMEPRVYRTKELLADGETNKELMTKFGAIEPDSWAALGGPGQMHTLPGVLVVTQNRRVHEQIGRLLTRLHRGRDKPTT